MYKAITATKLITDPSIYMSHIEDRYKHSIAPYEVQYPTPVFYLESPLAIAAANRNGMDGDLPF